MMTVGQLKKILKDVENDNLTVIFEYQENGKSAEESYSIDDTEQRFDTFFMLISEGQKTT